MDDQATSGFADFEGWINGLNLLHRNQELLFEVLAVGVLRPELRLQGLEADELRLAAAADRIGLVGRPAVEIEGQRGMIQGLEGAGIDRDGRAGDRLKEVLAEFNPALEKVSLFGVFRIPPELSFSGDIHVETLLEMSAAHVGVLKADRCGKEPAHLLLEPESVSALPSPGIGIQTYLAHELRKRAAQLQDALLGADGLAGEPVKQEPGDRAVGIADHLAGAHVEIRAGNHQRQVAVGARPCRKIAGVAVGQGDLNQMLGHVGQLVAARPGLHDLAGGFNELRLTARDRCYRRGVNGFQSGPLLRERGIRVQEKLRVGLRSWLGLARRSNPLLFQGALDDVSGLLHDSMLSTHSNETTHVA